MCARVVCVVCVSVCLPPSRRPSCVHRAPRMRSECLCHQYAQRSPIRPRCGRAHTGYDGLQRAIRMRRNAAENASGCQSVPSRVPLGMQGPAASRTRVRRDDASRLEEARELEGARGAVARHRIAQQVVELVDIDAWRRGSAAPLVSRANGERRKRRAATRRRCASLLTTCRGCSRVSSADLA